MMRRGMGLRLGDIATGAAAAPKSTLVDGLVSYWSLDEASGQRNDSVGTNHLTDNNTVGSDTGMHNAAASFVAANSESLSVALSPGDIYTVTFWYKVTGSGTDYGWFQIDNGNSAEASLIGGFQESGTGVPRVRAYESDFSANVTVAFTPATAFDVWHLAFVWIDADKKLNFQLDAEAVQTSAVLTTLPVGIDRFLIGYRPKVGDYMNGLLDEVAIWSRVLTADERAELYNSGDGKFYNATSEDFE